ncbi:MAG: hypothetical protein MRECE_3c005 [Mycoplasmataceae bacterium CE_OT135]|nr:MAG: hypothetical protein MRECE_18c022 [Mycoplasmataceae bacterium CE_OT135]KLL04082.1 MAG: hypothetical protein MRECE_3c005 [Mycoplasmataceae bacterium CE_OT135]
MRELAKKMSKSKHYFSKNLRRTIRVSDFFF